MRTVALLAAIVAFPASADYVSRQGADYIRLTEGECPASVPMPADQRSRFLGAVAVVDGKEYRACWALRQDGMVLVFYDDGDAGLIHSSQFKPEEGL